MLNEPIFVEYKYFGELASLGTEATQNPQNPGVTQKSQVFSTVTFND